MFSAFLQLPHTTMTIVEIPPGIYRIVVAGLGVDGVQPEAEALTRHDYVTIRPPNEVPDPEQKVICRFLTSSISPGLLVENQAW